MISHKREHLVPKLGQRHRGSVRFDPVKLRDLREGKLDPKTKKSISQAAAALLAGISTSTYVRAERGKYVEEVTAQNIGIALGTDFRKISTQDQEWELNAIKRSIKSSKSAALGYNFSPATGAEDEKYGIRECPIMPGRLVFVKWHDAGGPGYDPTYPYDRPNRAMTVRRFIEGRRLWWEYNLTSIVDGEEIWKGPAHVWTEVDHEFPAIGDHRTGLILFRIDIVAFSDGQEKTKVLEFCIPNDSGTELKNGKNPEILMRWTSGPKNTEIQKRTLVAGTEPFHPTDFFITQVIYDD